MARRFIVKDNDLKFIKGNSLIISGQEVKHIQVLRHNIGDEIIINNLECKITKMTKVDIEVDILREHEKCGEPSICVTLYMAMLKNDKMDFVVQKAVELGVKKIVPFFSNNTIVKLDATSRKKRREKLQIIADEACKQCGRTDIVSVLDFDTLDGILKSLNGITMFAYEKETVGIKEKIKCIRKENINVENISLIVGAEGGFDPKEAENVIKNKGVYSVSLGDRILRAETAALNLISLIMYEFDS